MKKWNVSRTGTAVGAAVAVGGSTEWGRIVGLAITYNTECMLYRTSRSFLTPRRLFRKGFAESEGIHGKWKEVVKSRPAAVRAAHPNRSPASAPILYIRYV